MFVEMVEEISLLRLVDAGQHVFRVQQSPDYAHQLDGSSHVCVADHALDDNVHQQPVIVRGVDLECHQMRSWRGREVAGTYLLQHVLPHQAGGEVHDEEKNVHRSSLSFLH